MKEEKFPQVWDEKGGVVKWEDLQIGHLVKIILEGGQGGCTEYLGIFRGLKDYECGKLFLLEIPFGGTRQDAPSLCQTKVKEWVIEQVNLVKILARDIHAIHVTFHHYGTLKVEYDDFKARMREAHDLLSPAKYSNR
jgi:hypothetical protein